MDAEVMNAEGTGNTIAVPSESLNKNSNKRARKGSFGPSRGFAWTLFNYEEEWDNLYKYFKSRKSFRYIICGKEICPDTGRIHYQGYVYYDNEIYIAKSKIGTLHIEKARYSAAINEKYCKKGNDIIVEEGEKPHPGKKLETGEDLKKMSNEEILNNDPYHGKRLIETKDALIPITALNWTKKVKVYYIWGESGIGKSNWVQNKLYKKDLKCELIYYSNGFWNGIRGIYPCAIYEEFRHEVMKPQDFIQLIDYRRHRVNVKGGNQMNEYTTIFITSIEDPNHFTHWYYETKKQWIRRLKVIHITEPVELLPELKQKLDELFDTE